MRPHPQILIERAVHEYGEDEVIHWSVSLLSGQAVRSDLDIRFLGGTPDWTPYWSRVWGARTFLYVWNESAAPSVVDGLSDEHWRVREMCAKVCRLRELTDGTTALILLAADENERVRLSALRAIGDICEADAAGPLLATQIENHREADVAKAALQRMEQRLDRRLH